MNKLFKILIFISIIISVATSITDGHGLTQGNMIPDSLSLSDIIKKVTATHPSISAGEEAVNNAGIAVSLSKAGYYPEADLTAGYSNIGPVTKLTIPEFGTVELFPQNNYSASVNYRQTIYDFGRTKRNIELENENKVLNVQALEQMKQKLSLTATYNFYSLVYLQAAIRIKDEQLSALNEHLTYVEKMMSTGSATEYQVLSTKVKISTVESQKVDLQAALTAQQASLNSLLGNETDHMPVVRTELSQDVPVIPQDSMLNYAFNNRDEMMLNKERTSLAEIRFGMAKLQNKPNLNFQASAGAKNGYIPELNQLKPNYVIGIGLRIPIYDGLKTRYRVSQAQSAITSLSYETELAKRNISTEVIETEANMNAASKKVKQFELQLDQAVKANSLAQTSFRSGTITNLDLLDANTSLSESRLMLLKAKIDYVVSIFKLKAALGIRLY